MYNKLQYYNVARYKFTQRPHLVVSECAHALEVRCPLCGYTWKRCVFKEERAVSRNGLVFNDVCVSEYQDTAQYTHSLRQPPVEVESPKEPNTPQNYSFLSFCGSSTKNGPSGLGLVSV